MRIKYFPEMSEISLWQAWNDALNAGEEFLEDKEGRQFIGIGFGLVIGAKKDTYGEYDIKIEPEGVVRSRYRKETMEDLYDLKKAKKPMRLE